MRQDKYKVLLVYPRPAEQKSSRFGYSLNLLYVAAILKNEGYKCTYIDYSIEEYSYIEYVSALKESDVVIIEYDSFSLKRSLNHAHGNLLLRITSEQNPRIIRIALGYDCIMTGEENSLADYTFTRGWEASMVQVIEAFTTIGKPGDEIVSREMHFDKLPYPARELLSEYAEHGGNLSNKPLLARSTLLQTSRGCGNTCVFCQRGGWNSNRKEHSLDYSEKEFCEVYDAQYKNIWITDENFTFNLIRAKELLKRVARYVSDKQWCIALSSWTHIDHEYLDICCEAGVRVISFGIESACKRIQKYYKKSINLDEFKELAAYANTKGIYVVGNFIIGAPMETNETIQQSIQYAKETYIDQINVKTLDYMLGSELYKSLPSKLRINNKHVFASRENGLCAFSEEELKKIACEFVAEVKDHHAFRLKEKLFTYGPPYILR